ncbi:hypothetical protein AB1N83_014063, partial [Pleurotus pulmonarius]
MSCSLDKMDHHVERLFAALAIPRESSSSDSISFTPPVGCVAIVARTTPSLPYAPCRASVSDKDHCAYLCCQEQARNHCVLLVLNGHAAAWRLGGLFTSFVNLVSIIDITTASWAESVSLLPYYLSHHRIIDSVILFYFTSLGLTEPPLSDGFVFHPIKKCKFSAGCLWSGGILRRKWLGWYNSPGSYNVAKRYGQLARSRFWDGLFPGPNVEPAVLLGLDGAPGPKYWGIQSGTILPQTTQMGHNFAEYCKSKAPNPTQPWIPVSQDLRKATSTTVMIITVELPHETENSPTTDSIAHIRTTPPRTYLIASIPIGSSIAACVACALFGDWFSFALILLGVLCNGFACLVIGSAKLVFRCPRASVHSPPGNGIVTDANSIILVRGTEHAVNSVVKSRLVLQYGSKAYHPLGAVALALTLQFILQLLLIPQAELFGQIMFLSTLGIS